MHQSCLTNNVYCKMQASSSIPFRMLLMTVIFSQLSTGGSLTAVSGMIDTDSPLAEQLLKLTQGGILRHGHNLKLRSRRPEVHFNMSSIYQQLLQYLNGRHDQRKQNVSNLPAAGCTCLLDVDSYKGKFTQAVKITLIILGFGGLLRPCHFTGEFTKV